MTIKDYIDVTLSGSLVIANIFLLCLNLKNLKMIKELSSPKPFLKVVGTAQDGFKPVISISNFGSGHAVNVKVKVTVNVLKDDIAQGIWVDYHGDNVIPFIQGNECRVDYHYKGTKHISMADDFKVSIEYESDSGAKGKIIWKYVEKSGFVLIEGR